MTRPYMPHATPRQPISADDTGVACFGVLVTVREPTHEMEEWRPRPPSGPTDQADAVSCTCSNASRGPGRLGWPHRQNVPTPGAWHGQTPGEARHDDGPGNADTTSSPAGSAACCVCAGGWHPVGHGAGARRPRTSPDLRPS